MSRILVGKAVFILFLVLVVTPDVEAKTSGGTYPPTFTYESGEWYDSWGITRTNAYGDSGYLPILLSETTGENSDLALRTGERLRNNFNDNQTLASSILTYVQTWVEYGYDVDNVYMNKRGQDEWAWNADELAYAINETMGIGTVGDCEDMSFLCATLYMGAGIDIAIVDAPGHVALLIWLPEYPNANKYWDLSDDGRDAGWIWIEATGPTNPIGWTPSDFTDGEWTAWTIQGDNYYQHEPVQTWGEDADGDEISNWDIIIMIIIILFILFSRR
jgi:hypothetical protein